jgi:hypothetical protein
MIAATNAQLRQALRRAMSSLHFSVCEYQRPGDAIGHDLSTVMTHANVADPLEKVLSVDV